MRDMESIKNVVWYQLTTKIDNKMIGLIPRSLDDDMYDALIDTIGQRICYNLEDSIDREVHRYAVYV